MRDKGRSEFKARMKGKETRKNFLMEMAEDMVSFVMSSKTMKNIKRKMK